MLSPVETAVENLTEKVEDVGFLGVLTEASSDPFGFLKDIFTPKSLTSMVFTFMEDPLAALTSALELLAGLATTILEDPISALFTTLTVLGITATSVLTLILSHLMGLPTGGLVGNWALVIALETLGIQTAF